jgi:hypothetical protein
MQEGRLNHEIRRGRKSESFGGICMILSDIQMALLIIVGVLAISIPVVLVLLGVGL